MLKHLSHYTHGQLDYLLARIREVAALGDEAALIETDKLVWEIMGDDEEGGGYVASLTPAGDSPPQPTVPFYDQPAHALERRISHIEFSHECLKRHLRDGPLNHWIVLQFDRDINGDQNYWRPMDLEDERLVLLMGEYQKSLDDAWQIVVPKTIKECASWPFKNIASVSSMMTSLEQVVGGYTQHHALTDEMKQMIREAKERGARFRWGKKISDAEVAEAAGYIGKATGIRKEAEALLAKDWVMVFAGEDLPEASEE